MNIATIHRRKAVKKRNEMWMLVQAGYEEERHLADREFEILKIQNEAAALKYERQMMTAMVRHLNVK